ncbi:hypothetical protein MRX96_050405, partial [Rhipicephalus microplus]
FENVHIEKNPNLTNFTLGSLLLMNKVVTVLSLYGNALETFEYDKLEFDEQRRLRSFTSLESLDLGRQQAEKSAAKCVQKHPPAEAFAEGKPESLRFGAAAFFGLTNLTELLLSQTRLMKLGGHSLSFIRANPHLKIDLSRSAIKTIESTAFDAAMPLEVDLSHNKLTELPRKPFEGLIIRMISNARGRELTPVIKVEGNPLTCMGCSYVWIIESRKRKRVRIIEGFKCPDGLNATSLTRQRIKCKPPGSIATIG